MTIGINGINGIKRQAKRLKKEQNIPHHEALEIVAKQHGYQNFKHAQRTLANEQRN